MSTPVKTTPHRPILAERFKTKMCQNYEKSGACAYEARCMFAHGDDDLRTKEMNLKDSLTTEDAIRAFQRAKWVAEHGEDVPMPPGPKAAAAGSPKSTLSATTTTTSTAPRVSPASINHHTAEFRTPSPKAMPTPDSTIDSSHDSVSVHDDALPTAAVTATAAVTPPSKPKGALLRKYRHDPYAPVEYGYIDYHTMSYAASPALTPRASMALPPPMSMDDILTPAEYGAPAHSQPSFGHSPATSYSAAARSPPGAATSTSALARAAAAAAAATSRGASPAATPVSMYAAGVRSPQATPLVTPSASPAASPSKFAAINKSFAAHSDQCFCAECTGVSSMATGGSGPFTQQQPRLPAPRHAKAAAASVPGAPTIASTYGAASRSPSTSPAASAGFHRRPQSILLA
jgi:hypothetical protein